jgi:hypothetical protein
MISSSAAHRIDPGAFIRRLDPDFVMMHSVEGCPFAMRGRCLCLGVGSNS